MSWPVRLAEMLAEHPRLAWLLDARTRLGVTAGAELIVPLAADWQALRSTLLRGRAPGRLIDVRALGDSHDGGRRVLALEFAEGARIAYELVWRDSTEPLWTDACRVGDVTSHTIAGLNKDDFQVGVRAIDRDGNRGRVAFRSPPRSSADPGSQKLLTTTRPVSP